MNNRTNNEPKEMTKLHKSGQIKISLHLLLGDCLLAETYRLFDSDKGVFVTHFKVLDEFSIEYSARLHLTSSQVLELDVHNSQTPQGFILAEPASMRVAYHLPGVLPHQDMYRLGDNAKQFDWQELYHPIECLKESIAFWRRFNAC